MRIVAVEEHFTCQDLLSRIDCGTDQCAASNRNLEVDEGRFSHDLFYRLGVFLVEVPPFRERRDDIAELLGIKPSTLASRISARGHHSQDT